jgi:hypothetical protein
MASLSVIVVAGACGLVVGTPIALLAATGKISKKGIIVKGGMQIENLKQIGTIVFDKIGTHIWKTYCYFFTCLTLDPKQKLKLSTTIFMQ